jgi:hypothetical protein
MDLPELVEQAAASLDGVRRVELAAALRRAMVEADDATPIYSPNDVPIDSVTTIRLRLHPSDQALRTEDSRYFIDMMLETVSGGRSFFVVLE